MWRKRGLHVSCWQECLLGRGFPWRTPFQQFPFKNTIAINLHYTDELNSVVFADARKAFSETPEETLVSFRLKFHNKKASLRMKSIKPLSVPMKRSLLNEPMEQNSATFCSKNGAERWRRVGAATRHRRPSGMSVPGTSFFFLSLCH